MAVMRAFVDESGSRQHLDPGAYLLCAAMVQDADAAHVRSRIAALKLPGQVKLHWRDESLSRQHRIIESVAALPVDLLVVVHVSVDRKPEQRRHRALRVLLPALAAGEVRSVVAESRGRVADARDRAVLDAMRRSRVLDDGAGPLHLDHVLGRDDPVLWVADAVCGAVVEARTGSTEHVDRLGTMLRIIES